MMFEKALALFDRRKLANYACFFGCMVLGIAAMTGMAWTHCELASRNQNSHATGGDIETCAAEKGACK